MTDYIDVDNCKHGYLYRIRSRNLAFGVYKTGDRGFVGIRQKFDTLYLFTEYHYDNGPPFGTVRPEEELERCPIEGLVEHFYVCGTCRKPTVQIWGAENDRWLVQEYRHFDDTPICPNPDRPDSRYGAGAAAFSNRVLFNWLQERETYYRKDE